ncbi:family 10 glycosylhydrolase [Paenibacillus sp. GCM10027626]|uniref:family 10 glycosylhydrolase n=1 Tax=Paenibacillus sp. GCM10027626 TaxID=3273411 RepID=UPI003639A6BE
MDNQLIFSSPLTFTDWLHRDRTLENGPDGVYQVLSRCKDFGFNKIYWRVFDAGRATYFSKLVEPFRWKDLAENNHFSLGYFDWPAPDILERLNRIVFDHFDSLAAAVRIGHELGLEIHAWMSINEDDHGVGWESKFTREHPEYRWVRRNGRRFHSQLSYAFPAVREYKLGLVKEMLAYDIDGIFLDWIRTGDISDNPQNDDAGVVDYGYEQPNIARFKEMYGEDPFAISNDDERWIRCRAEPVTQFMRDVRELVSRHPKPLPLSVMVQHPWSYRGVLPGMTEDRKMLRMGGSRIDGALNGLLCDIKTWAREGLMDELVAAGYYTGEGTPEKATLYAIEETENRLPVWLYGWVPKNADDLRRDIALAEKLTRRQILFWEADYIDSIPAADRKKISEAIRGYGK